MKAANLPTVLAREICAAKSDDPLAAVTVVVPSYYSALFLRRAVAECIGKFPMHTKTSLVKNKRDTGGLFNVEFMDIEKVAKEITSYRDMSRGWRPLPKMEALELLRQALRNVGGYGLNCRTLQRRVHDFLEELSGLSQIRKMRLVGICDNGEKFLRTLDESQKLRAGMRFLSRSDMAMDAVRLIEEDSDTAVGKFGRIIVLSLLPPYPRQRRLMEAIIGLPETLTISFDYGEGELSRRTVQPRDNSRLKIAELPRPAVRLLAADDETHEVRAVVRNILSQARRGAHFDQIGVLYGRASYHGKITDALTLAAIPYYTSNPVPLSKTPEGRFITGIFRMKDENFGRESVMWWLSSAPVKSMKDISASRTQWRKVSRSAFLAGLKDDAAYPETSTGGYASLVSWLRNLVKEYMLQPRDPDAVRRDEALNSLLDEAAGLQDVADTPVSFDVFRDAIEDGLASPADTPGGLGLGVFVSNIESAAGCAFEAVHILGMADGSFPAAESEDPFLNDGIRREIDPKGEFLPAREDKLAVSRIHFLLALASAPSCLLYWPMGWQGKGRVVPPSMWFMEQSRILSGNPTLRLTDIITSGHEVVERVDKLPPLETASDTSDYNLISAGRRLAEGRSISGHYLAEEDVVRRGLSLHRARQSFSFTAFDGDVSAAIPSFRDPLSEETFSAVNLETYTQCPFRYFMRTVLGIESAYEDAGIFSLSPLDKGKVVHKTLERFVNACLKLPPMAADEERLLLMRMLDSTADEYFEGDEENEGIPRPLLWRVEREELAHVLDLWLDLDMAHRALGWNYSAAEMEFGIGKRGTSKEAESGREMLLHLEDAAPVSVKGTVDRVDISTDRRRAVVFDYKTGGKSKSPPLTPASNESVESESVGSGSKPRKKRASKRHGLTLQLALYSEAVSRLLEVPDDVSAAIWFLHRDEVKQETLVSFREVREDFYRALSVISSGIRSGMFPARPGTDRQPTENCTNCDFDRVCLAGSRRYAGWRKKRYDSRLAGYLKLADPPGDGDA